jgi:hypothetical protein
MLYKAVNENGLGVSPVVIYQPASMKYDIRISLRSPSCRLELCVAQRGHYYPRVREFSCHNAIVDVVKLHYIQVLIFFQLAL